MKIFAIADPHLSLETPDKAMDRFGDLWVDHPAKIESAWRETVQADDLVLIAGDISWAMKLDGALADLNFLAALPGKKVMIKGNHDYWWQAIGRLRQRLPNNFVALQGDAVEIDGVVVCGTRLWDVPGVSFDGMIETSSETVSNSASESPVPDTSHIFRREVARLRNALAHARQLQSESGAERLIVMTHYPPCDAKITSNELTVLIEQAGVDDVVFGHLHGVRDGQTLFGINNGVNYHLTSCDWLNFCPALIVETKSPT